MDSETQENVAENIENKSESTENSEKESAHEEQLPASAASEEEVLSEKLTEANDKFLRLYSEFDNFRKRTAREKIELSKTAGEDIFKTILPVLDDFERGIKAAEEASDVAAVKEGMNLIFQKFKNSLQQKGLAEMESKGLAFDADLHEAITNIPAPDDSMKGKVVDELEKGYTLNGKVIRFAKVVVGA
ncbi:MAG: nucleotide exchange factor GrpE [Bacteroidetes bacterium]|nr:nucleotide exchange factor GrpE [Bacteroidota bacterium]